MTISIELKKRILTGVVGGIALLSLVIFGDWVGMFFLSTVLSLGMIYEFACIVFSMSDREEKKYVLLSVTWFVGLINLLVSQIEYQLLVVTFISLFAYFLISAKRHAESLLLQHFKELMFSLFGLIYVVFLPLYFMRIHESPRGIQWTLLFLFIVWAGDTGAYFAGKKYGKRKLYPQISPKKTLEGSIGGVLAGLAVSALAKIVFFKSLPWIGVFVIPLFVGPVSQVGDLCESFLKRAFDKKDSGGILPGHGGFLDRFDGVVFSLPVMYAMVKIFS